MPQYYHLGHWFHHPCGNHYVCVCVFSTEHANKLIAFGTQDTSIGLGVLEKKNPSKNKQILSSWLGVYLSITCWDKLLKGFFWLTDDHHGLHVWEAINVVVLKTAAKTLQGPEHCMWVAWENLTPSIDVWPGEGSCNRLGSCYLNGNKFLPLQKDMWRRVASCEAS